MILVCRYSVPPAFERTKVPKNSRWRTAAILKIILGEIFRFPSAFLASTSGHCDFMILPVWLEMPNHGPFWVFKIVGRHQNPQKAHPWVHTRQLSHKRSKSVQGCELSGSPRKKYNQHRKGQYKNLAIMQTDRASAAHTIR